MSACTAMGAHGPLTTTCVSQETLLPWECTVLCSAFLSEPQFLSLATRLTPAPLCHRPFPLASSWWDARWGHPRWGQLSLLVLGLGPAEQCLGPTSAALGNSAILRKLAPASPLALVGLWLHIFYNESAWWARLWAWRDPTVCHPLDPCPHILRAGGVYQGRSVGSAPVAFSVSLRVRPGLRAGRWNGRSVRPFTPRLLGAAPGMPAAICPPPPPPPEQR